MSTQTLSTQPSIRKTPWLKRPVIFNITPAALILVGIMACSAGLHFYHIQSIGDGNLYYSAAVKSMLQSWHNFFFIAAEPGGSVTVDKPPLGLWIEAAFAAVLGVEGWVVSLPNILAGILSIPLLYHMVKQHANEAAGLAAALVMAATPVFIATNRNNTMDGMLVFTLLLAAYAFIKATERGSLPWLLAGGFLLGLGFNIKMLQAFLPLPAFYALYFFAAKIPWSRKVLHLFLVSILLLVVSFAWVIAVDLTPADQRPYIGSSDNNTVMGLIFGHNGLSRLELTKKSPGNTPQDGNAQSANPQGQVNIPGPQNGMQPENAANPPRAALQACSTANTGDACAFSLPNGNTIEGSCITPPTVDELVCTPQERLQQMQQMENAAPGNGAGETQFSNETGSPGLLRFFTQPLSKQMSWLLPFSLISLLIVLLASRIQVPVQSPMHQALILWGGWLMTCLIFFSIISGIFHAYYTIMLVPALAAMVGLGFSQLLKWDDNHPMTAILMLIAAGLTLVFQIITAWAYGENSIWLYTGVPLLGLGIIGLLINRRAAYGLLLAAMLVIPLFWTVKTVITPENRSLPTAYTGSLASQPQGMRPDNSQNGTAWNLQSFLEANTQGMKYLAAVPSSNQMGAELVLATGRPVLYMGGFGGGDAVVDAGDLQTMVAAGDLRYILYGNDRNSQQGIAQWLNTSCSIVPQYQQSTGKPTNSAGKNNNVLTLYDCQS